MKSATAFNTNVVKHCRLRSKTCSNHQHFLVYWVKNWTNINMDWYYCFGF